MEAGTVPPFVPCYKMQFDSVPVLKISCLRVFSPHVLSVCIWGRAEQFLLSFLQTTGFTTNYQNYVLSSNFSGAGQLISPSLFVYTSG